MSYDQYWNEDCNLTKAYRKAFKIKRDLKNQDLWLQGLYIYEALCDVSPAFRAIGAKKPTPYRSEPYDFNKNDGSSEPEVKTQKVESKEDKADKKAKEWMEILAIEWNSRFEKGEVGVKNG